MFTFRSPCFIRTTASILVFTVYIFCSEYLFALLQFLWLLYVGTIRMEKRMGTEGESLLLEQKSTRKVVRLQH